MKNKVRCYSYDEINEAILKEFSEGSKALEDLLNYCYKNKIVTRACCIGHKEDGPQSKPYISFINSEEQQYLMEKIINTLFSQEKFSKHVSVDINREDNKFMVTFRFDYLENELRDTFFMLIQKAIKNTLENEINVPGKYDGLFDIYSQTDDEPILTITNDGIVVSKATTIYARFDGNDLKEVSKEEADFTYEKQEPIHRINSDEIDTFIANVKKKNSIHKH